MALVTQHDLAQLDDRQVRMLAVVLNRAACDDSDPAALFWFELSRAVVRANRERRRLWLLAAHELEEDDDTVGALVEEGDMHDG